MPGKGAPGVPKVVLDSLTPGKRCTPVGHRGPMRPSSRVTELAAALPVSDRPWVSIRVFRRKRAGGECVLSAPEPKEDTDAAVAR